VLAGCADSDVHRKDLRQLRSELRRAPFHDQAGTRGEMLAPASTRLEASTSSTPVAAPALRTARRAHSRSTCPRRCSRERGRGTSTTSWPGAS
jgi:hypothetical protein